MYILVSANVYGVCLYGTDSVGSAHTTHTLCEVALWHVVGGHITTHN
jgi:hypothetical protein